MICSSCEKKRCNRLNASDRQAILEILRDKKKDLPLVHEYTIIVSFDYLGEQEWTRARSIFGRFQSAVCNVLRITGFYWSGKPLMAAPTSRLRLSRWGCK